MTLITFRILRAWAGEFCINLATSFGTVTDQFINSDRGSIHALLGSGGYLRPAGAGPERGRRMQHVLMHTWLEHFGGFTAFHS